MTSNRGGTGGGITYSTTHGRMCPACERPIADCACRREVAPPQGDGIVRVARETKGRKGAGVTLITGVPLAPSALDDLCRDLKRSCGTGGTVKDGVIEIQGDQRDRLIAALEKRGFKVRRVGG